MNIRKHWKKICLAVTAFFWAGCSDNEATVVLPSPFIANDSNSSSEVNPGSSESIMNSVSSSTEDVSISQEAQPGSSDEQSGSTELQSSSSDLQSSSSEISSSSSVRMIYKLASDTTIACGIRDFGFFYTGTYCPPDHKDTCETADEMLSKLTTLDSSTIFNYEETLLECASWELLDGEEPLYGVPSGCHDTHKRINFYICEDGKECSDVEMQLEGDLLYTKDEYNAKFPSSSSSSEISSSSLATPADSCKYETLLSFDDLVDTVKHEIYLEIVQKLDSGENPISAEVRDSLETILNREEETLSITLDGSNELYFNGYVLRTKTCADGSEELTDMYQKKHDEIRDYIQSLIDN